MADRPSPFLGDVIYGWPHPFPSFVNKFYSNFLEIPHDNDNNTFTICFKI